MILLARNGIPTGITQDDWTDLERTAAIIIIGEMDGGEFDWATLSWKKPRT